MLNIITDHEVNINETHDTVRSFKIHQDGYSKKDVNNQLEEIRNLLCQWKYEVAQHFEIFVSCPRKQTHSKQYRTFAHNKIGMRMFREAQFSPQSTRNKNAHQLIYG